MIPFLVPLNFKIQNSRFFCEEKPVPLLDECGGGGGGGAHDFPFVSICFGVGCGGLF